MSILERLAQTPPRHKAFLGDLNPKYQVTRHYMAEIEEAKKQGYSWGQIKKVVVEEAKEEGIWDSKGECWDLGEIVRKIKKAQ